MGQFWVDVNNQVLKATDAIAHITDPAVVELRLAMDRWLRFAGTMAH